MKNRNRGFHPDEIYEQTHEYLTTQLFGKGKDTTVPAASAEVAIMLMAQQYVNKFTPMIGKTMSTYEKTVNRMKSIIFTYQKKCERQKSELLKANIFINKLRDEGRLSKDEIEIYFKK